MSLKTLIGTAIISLGVAGIIFVAKNSAPSFNQTANSETINNNTVSDKPFVEAINNNSDPSNQQNSQSANLTETFTKNLAEKLQQENPLGPVLSGNNKGIKAPNPDDIALELLVNAQEKFDAQQILQNINDNDIKITNENTKASLISYAEKFDAITSEWKTKINNPNSQQEFTNENINEIISAYKNVIQKFYNLPVPKLLANMHKTEIKYLKAELALFEKINSPEKDPVGSLVASGNFEKLDKEFNQKVNEEIQLFLKIANNL